MINERELDAYQKCARKLNEYANDGFSFFQAGAEWQRSQQGALKTKAAEPTEAVEVVATVTVSFDEGDEGSAIELCELHTLLDEGVTDLMTVDQHKRLMAAATHPADQVAEGVVVPVQLLKIIEQSWRIPSGCPKSVSEEVGEIISNGLAELRALLAKSEGAKP